MNIKNIEIRDQHHLKEDWMFLKKDIDKANAASYEEQEWKKIKIPHDWAREGSFDKNNDIQPTTILEDGLKKEIKHTGRTGGLPVDGKGWYKKIFNITEENKEKTIYLEFDGIMSNSTVYINGEKIGFHPYGYTSFVYDITESVKYGEENTILIKVDPEAFASRWYPGAGIYRNIKAMLVNPVHIAPWGTYITTPNISKNQAQVKVNTRIKNKKNKSQKIELDTTIIDPKGIKKAAGSESFDIENEEFIQQKLRLRKPKFWNLENPELYTVISVIKDKESGVILDEYETPFGIRKIDFDADRGFFLNGENIKLKGVCRHHDLGPLGAAVNERAIARQLDLLKEMGCNAIRTSHNPPAPEFLDLCDQKGFLVIDEAFDEWKEGKVDNGYHQYFEKWAEKDLKSMIKRDRNHPAVIMWSIGNEIREQKSEAGAEVAQFLTDICHQEDPTRPVTAGFNNPQAAIENGLAEIVDIPGWNYEYDNYESFHKEHSSWIMYGSETESCLSSRGEYFLPAVEKEEVQKRENLQVSSYDLEATAWGYPPDYEFKAQEDLPYLLGEFVWTGFDYLGEPTPYYKEWPSRSSYFGIMDLCGFPKDRYFLYKSHWSDNPTLHLLPHWNWEGKEGEKIPVFCYTNYDTAELFVNGKSQGIKEKNKNADSVFQRYRLMWKNVIYEPGSLQVVAYDENGEKAMVEEIKTAGAPARIQLQPERSQIKSNGEDLCFITAAILDKNNNICPQADNKISFSCQGPGEILATGNGDPTNTTSFTSRKRKTFNGLGLVIVRSCSGRRGRINITAEAEGLKEAEVIINSGS